MPENLPQDAWFIDAILQAFKDKPFVKRILQGENQPVIRNPDGSVSTHRMAWENSGTGADVFPTIQDNPVSPGLVRSDPQTAYINALALRDLIHFNSPEMANYFSQAYKAGMGVRK